MSRMAMEEKYEQLYKDIRCDIRSSGILELWDEFRMGRFGEEISKENRQRNFRRIATEKQLKSFTRFYLVKNINYLRELQSKVSPIVEKYLPLWFLRDCPKKIRENIAFLLDFQGDILWEMGKCNEILETETYEECWEKDYELPLHELIPNTSELSLVD